LNSTKRIPRTTFKLKSAVISYGYLVLQYGAIANDDNDLDDDIEHIRWIVFSRDSFSGTWQEIALRDEPAGIICNVDHLPCAIIPRYDHPDYATTSLDPPPANLMIHLWNSSNDLFDEVHFPVYAMSPLGVALEPSRTMTGVLEGLFPHRCGFLITARRKWTPESHEHALEFFDFEGNKFYEEKTPLEVTQEAPTCFADAQCGLQYVMEDVRPIDEEFDEKAGFVLSRKKRGNRETQGLRTQDHVARPILQCSSTQRILAIAVPSPARLNVMMLTQADSQRRILELLSFNLACHQP
jgi:hypothetical protein